MSLGTTLSERSVLIRPRRMNAGLTAQLSRGLDQDALWARWSTLEGQAVGTAFQARTFVEPLMRRLAPALGREGFVLEVSDASGPVLAVALAMRRWRGARIIELADLGYSDCCGPLVRRGARFDADALAGLDAALKASLPPHDALIFKRMAREIDGQANPFAALPGARTMGCGAIQLPAGHQLAGASATIRNGERKARKLLREGGAIRRIMERDEAQAALERAFAWRLSQSPADGPASPLAPPAARDFYREVIGNGVVTGHSVLYEIASAEGPIGLVHGFVHGGRYHGSLMAVDRDAPAARIYSPGLIGMLAAIREHLATQTGGVDFGAGNSEYKTHFRGEFRSHVMLSRARTPLGAIAIARARLYDAGRHWMRAHPEMAERIRRWRGY